MKKIMTLLLTIAFNLIAFAQLENNNWYFGNDTAINFDTSVPSIQTDSAMHAHENCSTVSDVDGNLLFYTNGISVWNKNHDIMLNGTGLLGYFSSAQAIIIPDLTNPNRYYIFTTGSFEQSNIPRYSVVNMALDAGNGAIVSGEKNLTLKDENGIDLIGTKDEAITSYYDESTGIIWIIVSSGTKILSYKMEDSTTFSNVAIRSVTLNDASNYLGSIQMKISPNGGKFAISYRARPTVYTSDFNSTTGEINSSFDNVTFVGANPGTTAYGLEFSPNSLYLYIFVGVGQGVFSQGLKQSLPKKPTKKVIIEDINFPKSKASIFKCAVKKDVNSGYFSVNFAAPVIENLSLGSLQLAPDNKIYYNNRNYLGIIHNPNSASIMFDSEYLTFTSGTGLGLPQKVPHIVDCSSSNLPLAIFYDVYSEDSEVGIKLDSEDNVYYTVNTFGNSMGIDWLIFTPEFLSMLDATAIAELEAADHFILKFNSCGNLLDYHIFDSSLIRLEHIFDDSLYLSLSDYSNGVGIHKLIKMDTDFNVLWTVDDFGARGLYNYGDKLLSYYSEKLILLSSIDGHIIAEQNIGGISSYGIKGQGNDFYYTYFLNFGCPNADMIINKIDINNLTTITAALTMTTCYKFVFNATSDLLYLRKDNTITVYNANLNLVTSEYALPSNVVYLNDYFLGNKLITSSRNLLTSLDFDASGNYLGENWTLDMSGLSYWKIANGIQDTSKIYFAGMKYHLSANSFLPTQVHERTYFLARLHNHGSYIAAGRVANDAIEETKPIADKITNTIYPNPFSNQVSIALEVGTKQLNNFELFSALGKKLRLDYSKTATAFVIDTATLQKGYYYIQLHYTDGTTVIKNLYKN